jgi:hypothetical protein
MLNAGWKCFGQSCVWHDIAAFSTATSPNSQKQFNVTLPDVLSTGQPNLSMASIVQFDMQPGIWDGTIVLTDGQTLENHCSSWNQQLLWSDGPKGEHESGATATSQRQWVVRVAVAVLQPSFAGERRPEVTQLVLAQAGKPDRLTGGESSFVGVASRGRNDSPGIAAARLIVAMAIRTCGPMMTVERGLR